ncbi:tyrosine-type recombinase/integrase [Sphingobacterium anhuiense]|uniref:tyrosine-type recombinase/integrase n=1 Tax=Sphingobacterium anhuiense TaxID=493780 RepID=UPI003C2B8051
MTGREFESLRLHKKNPDNQLVGKHPDKLRTIMPTYKLINSYDAGGDIDKEWYVSYHYLIPEKLRKPNGNLYKRFRVFNTINSIHSKVERRKQLLVVKSGMQDLLQSGFNPFEQYSYSSNSNANKYNACRCIDEYLEFAKTTLKKNSYSVYEDRLHLFKSFLIDNEIDYKRIDQITKDNIFDFVTLYKANRGWANKTYNLYLQAIHSFLEFYIDNKENYLNVNVCAKIKRLGVQKKGNLPFNNAIFKDLLYYLKNNDKYLYQFCRLIYYSCMRPDAELRLLKIGHIDMFRRVIQVPSDNSKKNKTQYIPIDDELMNILLDMNLDRFNSTDYVFTLNEIPGPVPVYESYFRKRYLKVKNALGINNGETLYSFKHTRCIHLVQDGEKLHNIIKITRHKTLAELMDYLKDMGVVMGDEVKFKSRSI